MYCYLTLIILSNITHCFIKLSGSKYCYVSLTIQLRVGCPRGVMVKAMDCGIVVGEFVLKSRYYVHFRANTLREGMNPLILPAMG